MAIDDVGGSEATWAGLLGQLRLMRGLVDLVLGVPDGHDAQRCVERRKGLLDPADRWPRAWPERYGITRRLSEGCVGLTRSDQCFSLVLRHIGCRILSQVGPCE